MDGNPVVGPHGIHPDRMPTSERLAEIARILAAGMRCAGQSRASDPASAENVPVAGNFP